MTYKSEECGQSNAWWIILAVTSAFLLGYIWATYIGYKDMSQFGTQLQCTQSGEIK